MADLVYSSLVLNPSATRDEEAPVAGGPAAVGGAAVPQAAGTSTSSAGYKKTEDCFREYSNSKRINEFLDGKSRRNHLFFYFQRPDLLNESGDFVDSSAEPRIIITTGEQERLKGKACWFLRLCPEDKPIKLEIGSDSDLLFASIPNIQRLQLRIIWFVILVKRHVMRSRVL